MGVERVLIGKANVIQSPLTDGTDPEEELYRVDGFWGDRLELRVTGEDGDHYVRVGPGISRLQEASLTDTNSDGRVDVEYSHKTTRNRGKGGGRTPSSIITSSPTTACRRRCSASWRAAQVIT